jgi:hypothetical protein
MDTEVDTILDVKMEDEGHNRYQRLHAIVQEINSSPLVRTAEWYAEQNGLLHFYDNHFRSGFTDLHPEFTDGQFRANCYMLDKLIHKLMGEYERYHWFGIYDYKRFNEIAIEVVDYVYANIDEIEDDLSTMFNGMSV